MGSGNRIQGFTLFEMVVVICCIVILYMVAARRLTELPAAAEREAFYGTLGQIKTGIQLEMVNKLAGGKYNELVALEGTNPMNFFVEEPSNYRGELYEVTDRDVERRGSWYFETSTGQLVYVVGGRSIDDVDVVLGGVPVNLGQIRFRLTNVYGNGNDDEKSKANWQGLVLREIYSFQWRQRPETPIDLEG